MKSVFELVKNIVTRISPFTTMFCKGFFLMVIKSRDCVLKSDTMLLTTNGKKYF